MFNAPSSSRRELIFENMNEKKVKTRDGREARVIYRGLKSLAHRQSLIAIVVNPDGSESVYLYDEKGHFNIDASPDKRDLIWEN